MPPKGSRGTTRGRGASSRGGRGGSRPTAPEVVEINDSPAPASSTQDEVQQPEAPSAAPSMEAAGPSEMQAPPSRDLSAAASRASGTPAPAAKPGGRFKPKIVRRDQSERDKLDAERNRDLAVKIKAEEREQRDADRRARRSRGRGDRGRGMTRRTVTATGPFSSIPSENVRLGAAWGFSGSRGGQDGGVGASSGDGSLPPRYKAKYEARRQHESRLNIEELNNPDGVDEMFAQPGTGKKSASLLPVGMTRTEHKEEQIIVATTAELEAEDDVDEELFITEPNAAQRDLETQDDEGVWHAAPVKDPQVKNEPGTDEDAMEVDLANIPIKSAPSSPEQQKKSLLAQPTAKQSKRARIDKLVNDREINEAANELHCLLEELVDLNGKPKALGEGSLYLFQMPPILPPLQAPGSDSDGRGAINNQAHANFKSEMDDDEPRPTSSMVPPDGGYIGKLNVRKSGKVELNWGGRVLSLGMAMKPDFLTTTIMVEEKLNAERQAEGGTASGMGNIRSKFVLAPIFGEEADWDPDLQEELGDLMID